MYGDFKSYVRLQDDEVTDIVQIVINKTLWEA